MAIAVLGEVGTAEAAADRHYMKRVLREVFRGQGDSFCKCHKHAWTCITASCAGSNVKRFGSEPGGNGSSVAKGRDLLFTSGARAHPSAPGFALIVVVEGREDNESAKGGIG